MQIIEADFTWRAGRFMPGMKVAVAPDGRIAELETPLPATHRLAGRALLPGFVNVHSHAFQRGLRGRGETFPVGAGDFWTWREAMYALVDELNPESFVNLCRLAFEEMLAGGITTVGEFHYLHHIDSQARDYAFDDLILRAAREAGIRLVLLESFYKTGSVGGPLSGGQLRFETPTVPEFLNRLNHLSGRLDPRTQSLGIAPHSVRAVPLDDLVELNDLAIERGVPCHMHVEEQRKEIAEFQRAHKLQPLEWVLKKLSVGPHFTLIHGTHSDPRHLEDFASRGGHVCFCPSTEGNLGDGICDVSRLLSRPDSICIGTDANTRLDPAEDLRWLEYVQRLRGEKRGVYVGSHGHVAQRLLHCGTRNGAAALNVPAGEIEPDKLADFFTIDLNHVSLAGWTPETLLDSFIFGSGAAAIREVCVAGHWRSVDSTGRLREIMH